MFPVRSVFRLFPFQIVLLASFLLFGNLQAQNIEISGDDQICAGNTAIYSSNFADVTWSVTGGNIIVGSTVGSTVVVWWNGKSGTLYGSTSVVECYWVDPPPYINGCSYDQDGYLTCDWIDPPPYEECTTVQYSGEKSVTVNARPNPVSFTSGSAFTACVNTSGNSYHASMTPYTYNWSISAGNVINASSGNSMTATWNVLGSQSVTVSVTNPSTGCGSNPTTTTVNVGNPPVPTFTSSNPTVVCVGSAGHRYETQVDMESYEWTFSGGASVTAGGNSQHNYAVVTWTGSGSQSVAVRYRKGCWSNLDATRPITVNNPKTATIGGPPSVCSGNSGNYITESGMSQYEWIVSPGGTKTAGGGLTDNTITVFWHTPGANEIKVRYRQPDCNNIGPYGILPVTVKTLPTPGIDGPPTACPGTLVTYTTQPGMSLYEWIVSPGGTKTAGGGPSNSSVTVEWNTGGAQSVSVNYTNTGGCRAAAPGVRLTDVTGLTAHVVPSGPTSFCAGGSVLLLAFSEDGYSYQWSKNGTSIPGQTQKNYEASLPGAYRVTSTNGSCTKTSDPINIINGTKPTATITPSGPATICEGGNVVLNGSTGTNYTYQWKTEAGGVIEGATSSSYTATTSGNYILVSKLDGCASESLPQNVIVNPIPHVDVLASGPTVICEGATVTLKAIGASDSYQWKRGTTILTGETTDTYAAAVAGSYKAVVTKGTCSLETNAIAVTIKPLPPAVTAITGPATIPAGDKLLYSVAGNTTDDNYLWNTPAGTNIVYQNQKRSSATLGYYQLGEKIISVSAQKNGCESIPFEKTIAVIEAVTARPSDIPDELKVSPDRQMSLPLITRTFALNTLAQNQVRPVFEAPPCLEGEYYAGFQLSYDLADQNTQSNWTALLDITLSRGTTISWTRSMQIDMATQTFVSTIFHDSLISCNSNYQFKIKTKATNIGGVQAPEPNIYLKVLLYKHLTDVFAPTASLNLNYILTGDKVESSWSYSGKSARAYDLEWVFIENHESFNGSAQEAFKFKEPLRITTTDLSYRHHLYYPTGRLWFRARAVGYNPQFPDHRIPGQWFYGPATPLAVNNPEANKNWQAQTVFAENGKYKKIVNYFDGTLRQRQVQTNLSTEDLTLTGETLYDFEGRKAVDILPVPSADASLNYKTSFNTLQSTDAAVTANTTSIQKKFHYDNRQLINSVVSQSTGAGRYYSELNTIPSPLKDYVPDADGYVYNQTEFLNDGTGRVSRQSGVGEMFRMDGGKTTRHYYAEAARVELTRLFGPNVGQASHYKKNVVADANGQISVSYMDQAGQVIATALAGTPPSNVESLPGYQALTTAPLSVNLASKNAKANGVSQTLHKFLNEAPNNTYTFSYDLSAQITADPKFGCQSCTYDFTITITDPDGKLLDLSSVPLNESGGGSYQRKNLTAASCSASSPLSSVAFSLLLAEVGDYTITKTLTARELTFEQIKTIVSQNASVQQDLTNIENSYVVDPADCDICTTCTDAIGEAIIEIAYRDCEDILKDIIDKLKLANVAIPDYEPTQENIEDDPLFCKYELCVKNQQSDIFDKQLARVSKWSTASNAPYNYHTISNLSLTADPFFTNDELSGYNFKSAMQSLLNTTQIKATPYSGTLSQVSDPANTAYYINADGVADPSGYHILYYDLMSKRSQMTTEAYNQELDIQRWTLFRNFYMEAKRQLKLTLTDYSGCLEAKNDLLLIDNLPQATSDIAGTGTQIYNWGKDYNGTGKGVNVPVSDEELEMHIAMLNQNCSISISAAHAATIMGYFRTYFDSNEKNFLRLIIQSDIGTNANLNVIQTILNNHYNGCSLGSLAGLNPAICIKPDTKVFRRYGPNLISNPSFTSCPASAPITTSCSGWKPAWGSPYLMSDKGFQLEATDCAQDALMGQFTTALVPNKKYRLRFKRKRTPGITGSATTYISLSRSQGFNTSIPLAVPLGEAPTGGPVVMIAPRCENEPWPTSTDSVEFEGGGGSTIVWSGQNSSHPENDYQTVEKIFIPTQASTYIFFHIRMTFIEYTSTDVIIKDVEVQEVTETIISTCLEFAQLPDWQYEPNWAQQIDRCNQRAQEERLNLIELAQNRYLEEQASLFNPNCIAAANEQLSYSYIPKEHHYTLYYYDQAGNLVQTVPPEGVKVLTPSDANSAAPPDPGHTLVTRYRYSSVNQLAWQTSPDAGVSEFFYDKKGQLRLSRNAQQAIDNKYSYTKFDQQGRVIEVGELAAAELPGAITQYIENPRFPETGVTDFPSYPLSDITRTYYDNVNEAILLKLRQQNLRGRVSYVEVTDENAPDKTSTFYSYDIHGNVKSLLQQIPGLKEKRTDYVYDLISGKVNYVFYQYGKADQLIHKYTYDADNRVKTALTSSDAYLWNLEASYQYYAHGPLARTELGHHRVQGQDFYYTLQGWIKGVNMPFAGDPGADGISPSKVGKDAYAYALGYYQNDYKPSNASVVLSDTRDQQWSAYSAVTGNSGLYNGNIAWMVTDLAKIGDVDGNREKGMQAMVYKYDQLQRIRTSRSLTSYAQASGFASRATTPAPYDEDYTYDGNGNILTLKRYNETGVLMDDFINQYYSNTNKLRFLKPIGDIYQTDLVVNSGSVTPSTTIYRNITLSGSATVPPGQAVELVASNSIDMSPDFNVQADAVFDARMINDNEGTYVYDAIGNLISDNEKLVTIRWTPYGKVREVSKNNGAQLTRYVYDASGNRVLKKVTVSGKSILTHYVRDASGNVMGVYADTIMTEQPIYGSARLGEYKGRVPEGHQSFGERQYELTNHLGNVLAVITDNVTMQGAIVSAKVIHATDYYPFGLEMTGRKWKEDSTALVKATGLSARYQLNGDAQNINGNGMNGVVTGAVLTTDNRGEANRAYLFDGVDDRITLTNSKDSLAFIQNQGIFTITAFIKINNLNVRSAIVASLNSSSGKGFNFMYDTFGGSYGNHQLQFNTFKGVANDFSLAKGAQFTINDNQWHHVAVVGDGHVIRFYVDGVQDGAATALTLFSTGSSTKDVMIGGSPHPTNANVVLPMNGAIDEVNIFKKALSQADISKLAQRQPLVEGDDYRYAFNGKEKEGGEFGDTSYDYGFRIYNPSIGKFLSVDPITQEYPELTPYQFASNRPIDGIDWDGLEYRPYLNQTNNRGRPMLNVINFRVVNRTYRQTTNYTPSRPAQRGNINYIRDNGKPHQGKPQQTSDFEGSRNEFVVTLLRGLDNLQKFKEKLNIDIASVTDYDLNSENIIIGKNSSYTFAGNDGFKLQQLQNDYQTQVSEFINKGLDKISQDQFDKKYNELSPEESTKFNSKNPTAVSGLGLQAGIKFGPSPNEQVISQLNEKIKSGAVVPQKDAPVEQPSIRAGN